MASDWFEEMEKAEQEYDAREYELAQEYSRGYKQGRTDAIDEYKKKIEFEEKWLLACKVFDTNVDIAFKTLISYAAQLKEQKNDD